MDCNYFDKSNEQINKQKQQITVLFARLANWDASWVIVVVRLRSKICSTWSGWSRHHQHCNDHHHQGGGWRDREHPEGGWERRHRPGQRCRKVIFDDVGWCHWVVWWCQWLSIKNNTSNLDTTKTAPMWAALHVLLLDFLRFNLKSQLSRSMPSMPWMEEETRLSWNHT